MREDLIATFRTLHVASSDIPWVPSNVGRSVPGQAQTFLKVLHCNVERNLIASVVRAEPFAETALHRHRGHAFAYTLRGAWGHDRTYSYRPGTYAFEIPGVEHQFLNGPDETEALFVSEGDIEFLSPETGEVIGTIGAAEILDSYMQSCDALGSARPAVIRD